MVEGYRKQKGERGSAGKWENLYSFYFRWQLETRINLIKYSLARSANACGQYRLSPVRAWPGLAETKGLRSAANKDTQHFNSTLPLSHLSCWQEGRGVAN